MLRLAGWMVAGWIAAVVAWQQQQRWQRLVVVVAHVYASGAIAVHPTPLPEHALVLG